MFVNLGVHKWDSFVADAAKRGNMPPVAGAEESSRTNPASHSWDMGVGFDGAVKMASKGWPEGAQEIAKTLDTLPPDAEALPDWNMDVAGVICNVPSFVAGEPECMWHMSECKRNERRLSLIVQGTFGGGNDASRQAKSAIAVAAVMRSMEASGINVALHSVCHQIYRRPGSGYSSVPGETCAYATTVREFGEPLDLAKVAFAFHPAFFRRLGFAWREITKAAAAAGLARDGYARPVPISLDVVRALLGNDAGMVAILPGLNEYRGNNFISDFRDIVDKAIRSQS